MTCIFIPKLTLCYKQPVYFLHIYINIYNTGKLENGVNVTMKTNLEISPSNTHTFTYGTIGCGADTYSSIWSKGKQLFSCDNRLRSECNTHRTNFFRTSWEKYQQLDLLVIMDTKLDKLHIGWMKIWGYPHRARCILVFHGMDMLVSSQGVGFQKWCKSMRARGYDLRTWHLDATHCGAALWTQYTVTFLFPEDITHHVPNEIKPYKEITIRPCQNVMRLYGIPKYKYHKIQGMTPYQHPSYKNVIGKYQGGLVYHWEGPAGQNIQQEWIHIPNKGLRRITMEELSQLKGLNNTRYTHITPKVLMTTVEQQVWAILGKTIQPVVLPSSTTDSIVTPSGKSNRDNTENKLKIPENHPTWNWQPPDLSIGSSFYKNRIKSLRTAVDSLGKGYEYLYKEGLDILAHHRKNYGPEGPKSLTILWWEWPEVHWEELREGASMNFMEAPQPGLTQNQELKGEELATAIKFTEELADLNVLRKTASEEEVENNFPLFLVPKPGQPGEYRCIADGKSGGQNEVCVGDPCQMTSPDHILPQLNTGGWSGIIDASKYFHMFKTRKCEQRYLGLIHPGTHEMYVYDTLPMGTRNSPGASGRFGAAFVRFLIDKFPVFQGKPVDNSFMAYFTKKVYHPKYGEGRVLIGRDGKPAVLIWIHVDDILIHGPSYDKLVSAMKSLLDTTVQLGLICQPCKTTPPTQKVKFCGFIYDTENVPQLIIPDNKVSRAIALIDHLHHGMKHTFARLIVSMVVGFLQSLVPATPGNIGASFLQPIYDDLHQLQGNDMPGTKEYYYCAVQLSTRSQYCLEWWRNALTLGLSKQTQPKEWGSIGIAWGDGSGTGTGGTLNFMTLCSHETITNLDVWMGTWDEEAASATSNWKEMCTLHQTLLNEKEQQVNRVQHKRLIYCTDNMVLADVFRCGISKSDKLQKLFLNIKILEIELKCHLIVIHVPGTSMIQEGTDGLSRGVAFSNMNKYEGHKILPLLWRPAQPTPRLLIWAQNKLGSIWASPHNWLFHTDTSDWSRSNMINHNVLWCVSPGFGKQAILQALYTWVETPTTCGHIFIIPRVIQREFGRVSKFVLFHGQHTDLPLPFTPVVPFLLFYIPPFDRHVIYQQNREKQQLDLSPSRPMPFWIRKEVDKLHRLSHTD